MEETTGTTGMIEEKVNESFLPHEETLEVRVVRLETQYSFIRRNMDQEHQDRETSNGRIDKLSWSVVGILGRCAFISAIVGAISGATVYILLENFLK